jgi:integrase/recombinase XerD
MTPLRKRMIEALELRCVLPKTLQIYVDCMARFARHFGKSPEKLGAEEGRIYLVYSVQERKVACDRYKQALAALQFLYRWLLQRGEVVQDIRARRPERRLPVVLSFEEVHRSSQKHRNLLMFAYGAGLGISQAARVRVGGHDSQRMKNTSGMIISRDPTSSRTHCTAPTRSRRQRL